MFTITTISHPSLRSNSPSLAPPWVITLCLPPLPQYWLTLSHPSLSTNSVLPPSLKMVQNMVQKMVQKIVQSIFYPMPRKSNPLQTRVFFFTSIAWWSVEEDDTILSKVAKGKGKTGSQGWKNQKRYWGARQRIDIQLSKLQYSKRLFMFLHQGWHLNKEKETAFSTACLANFGSTGTSLFEIWTSAWRNIFSFLDRMLLFLSSLGLLSFSFLFIKDFLPLLIFPRAKIFP